MARWKFSQPRLRAGKQHFDFGSDWLRGRREISSWQLLQWWSWMKTDQLGGQAMNKQRLSCLVEEMSLTNNSSYSVRKRDSTRLYHSWVQTIFNLILSFLILKYFYDYERWIWNDLHEYEKTKKQGWWCLLLGISFLTSFGFMFVVVDQHLRSFVFIQVTISLAIKCGKPTECLSLHKNVAQMPSISSQTWADAVKTITTEFFMLIL